MHNLVTLVFPLLFAGGQAPAPTYHVGIAKTDITPDYPVRLSGFGFRRTESEGVRQRIWAKALAISDEGKKPFVLITTDNLGVPDEITQELAKRLGIDPSQLAVTATHTHTAPMLKGVAPTLFGMPIPADHQERINRYTRAFTDRLEVIARLALEDRRPSRLSWGIGNATLAINRRTKGGPVDHELPLLVIKDANDKPRALYFNYACHCVTLSENKIGGDWAGYAQEHLERMHPGVVALCSVGCGADSNPRTGVMKDRFDLASQQGEEIAAEVTRILKGPLRPISGPIASHFKRIDLAFDTHPTRSEWEEKAKRKDAIGYHARVNLERLDRGEALRTKISYPIQSWQFGDSLAMVFLPGEVVVDYSLRLKRELDGRRLWINAYSNASPCYIPSERVLKEGGYEGGGAMVYYDQPTKLKPGLEQQIVDVVKEQVGPKFQSPVDPKKTSQARPLAPEQSLALIKTHKDLVVELVAAEPLVTSPVAIDFGPDGKLWVAEMVDYPTGLDGNYKPGGRVRYLVSTKDDGKFDKAVTVIENIPFPTGVTVWRDGVLVCAAPDILFVKPGGTTRKLFSGFGTHNYQARVNSLVYGLDGWVYGSCGLFGGEITNFKGQKFNLGNRDFRIKPDTGELEPVTGRTQQGRVRDDWGNWFGCTNSVLCMHYPLDDHYLRRNPHVIPPPTSVVIPEGPDPNRLFPLKQDMQLFKLSGGPGRTTAACGLEIYRDNLLGEEYAGNAFVCEPVNLLVHRLQLVPRGVTFVGKRARNEEKSEFLASTDNWFRPVQVRTGPDGCLWIVDMYRYVIEHPRWIPDADLAKIDVRAGHDMGRIYRVRPKDKEPRPWAPLTEHDAASLVNALDTNNGWHRDMAGQLLTWNGHQVPKKAVERLMTSPRPQTRLHAFKLLPRHELFAVDLVRQARKDPHPAVRRHAILWWQSNADIDGELASHLLARSDGDKMVELQIAFSLGAWHDSRAANVLARMLHENDDVYLQTALLSSVNSSNIEMVIDNLFVAGPEPSPALASQLLAVMPTVCGSGVIRKTLDAMLPRSDAKLSDWQVAALQGLLQGLGRRNQTLSVLNDQQSIVRVRAAIHRFRAIAVDANATEMDRITALRILGWVPEETPEERDADLVVAKALVNPQSSPAIQSAALTTLGRLTNPRVAEFLVSTWKLQTPVLKQTILDILLSRESWQRQLLQAIQKEQVPPAEIDVARRQRLLEHKNPSVRNLAARVFAERVSPNREKVVAEYTAVVTSARNAQRGREVYTKTCAACHRIGELGHRVGPDLSALASKTADFFLMEILDPNRNIDPRYVEYQAVTKSGRIFTGLLGGETATSITLVAQEGKQQVLLRNEIDELQSTGKSLMPEGLEKEISREQMADLIAFLMSGDDKRVDRK